MAKKKKRLHDFAFEIGIFFIILGLFLELIAVSAFFSHVYNQSKSREYSGVKVIEYSYPTEE